MKVPALTALLWTEGDVATAVAAETMAITLQGSGTRSARLASNILVLIGPHDRAFTVRSNAAQTLFVFGTLFDRRHSGDPGAPDADISDWEEACATSLAERLITQCWGRYAAILRSLDGEILILRDPSAALPLYHVAHAGLGLVATEITPALLRALGITGSIDWDNLARITASPFCASQLTGLAGVALVPPAVLTGVIGCRDRTILWSPSRLALTSEPDTELETQLRRSLGNVLAALTGGSERVAVELSGGFDSSSVVGALRSVRPDLPIVGIHYALSSGEGDEAERARSVATDNGLTLVKVAAEPNAIDYRWLFGLDPGAQPRIAWLDGIQDATTPRIVEDAQADLVLTGHGGDVLFFQFASALVVADCLRTDGLGGPWFAALLDAAERARTSIWAILADLLRSAFARSPAIVSADRLHFLTPAARASVMQRLPRHLWQTEAQTLPPGKRRQIDSLAYTQLFHGPSWAGEAGQVVHPLLTQPMMETCLAIPTHRLAFGSGDRALARAAFARWLPPIVREARIKGGASGYYARAVLANLPFLRECLLDGLLVRHRILDRAKLEAALTRDALMVGHAYGPLTGYVALEAWAQGWS